MALILGGDGTITGNPDITLTESVSIAGTITYEDVTSIDSVGVITARSGLDVGPLAGIAVTISSSGFIKTTSFIQADRTSASQAAFVVNLNGAQKARINADGSAKFGGTLPNSPKIEFDENGSVKLTDKITSSSTGTFLTSQFTGICTDVVNSAFYGFSSLNSQTGAIIKAQYNQTLGASALLWEGIGVVGGSFQQTSNIKPDGSASFAAGTFAIESDGDISTNVRCHGSIELDSTGVFTSPKIKLFSNTGNAEFAGVVQIGLDAVRFSIVRPSGSLYCRGGDTGDGFIRCEDTSANAKFTVSAAGNGVFDGSLSKGSGSFKIDHPLPAKTETHHLVHSFIEGPQADLIYRGYVDLVDGQATVNIDTAGRMTEGTFAALCTNVSCFTSNESDWTAVKGSVTGNVLTITAQDNTSTAKVSWMVVGERKDQHMIDTDWTDSNGRVITEPLKS